MEVMHEASLLPGQSPLAAHLHAWEMSLLTSANMESSTHQAGRESHPLRGP